MSGSGFCNIDLTLNAVGCTAPFHSQNGTRTSNRSAVLQLPIKTATRTLNRNAVLQLPIKHYIIANKIDYIANESSICKCFYKV